ncbi:hypothetical protein BC835DRAFT_154326 [Cytidiella melzeri]|nr:hypothetical protein BC835DRAFT_154326 [Cytidiella melzeri]
MRLSSRYRSSSGTTLWRPSRSSSRVYNTPSSTRTSSSSTVIANETQANFMSTKMLFDDLDSTVKARGGSGAGEDADGALNRALNQILTEMDGMHAEKEVFIIGVTNRLGTGHVHPTLLRPGDSGKLIYIPLPDQPSCPSKLQATLKKIPVTPDVDFNFLAQHTHETKFRSSLRNTLRRRFSLAAKCLMPVSDSMGHLLKTCDDCVRWETASSSSQGGQSVASGRMTGTCNVGFNANDTADDIL